MIDHRFAGSTAATFSVRTGFDGETKVYRLLGRRGSYGRFEYAATASTRCLSSVAMVT